MTVHDELKPTYDYYAKAPIIWGILSVIGLILTVALAVAGIYISLYIIAPITLLSIIIASLYIARIIKVMRLEYKAERCIMHEVESPHYAVLFEGEPGSGKTDLAKRFSIYKADYMSGELVFESKLYNTLGYNNGTEQQQLDYKEVADTMEFYSDKNDVKICLCWNVPGKVDGFKIFKFEYETALQMKRSPYRTVFVIDEVDTDFPNADSILKIAELIEMFKYDRQFGLFTFYMTTQNKTAPMLALRNVSVNYTMLGSNRVLAPKALIYKYKIKRAKFMSEQNKEKAIILAKDINKLKDRIESIGFIRFERICRGGTEDNILKDNEDKTVILPYKRRYESDTRMFRKIYRPLNKLVELPIHNSTIINATEWREAEERRKKLRRALKARATKEKSPNAKKQ